MQMGVRNSICEGVLVNNRIKKIMRVHKNEKSQGNTKAAMNCNIIARFKIRQGIFVPKRELRIIVFQNVMVSSVCLSSEMYCCHYESHKIR
jgi:hypothetical protein